MFGAVNKLCRQGRGKGQGESKIVNFETTQFMDGVFSLHVFHLHVPLDSNTTYLVFSTYLWMPPKGPSINYVVSVGGTGSKIANFETT